MQKSESRLRDRDIFLKMCYHTRGKEDALAMINTTEVRRINGEDISAVIPGIVHVFRDDEVVPWHKYDECAAFVARRAERGYYITLAYDGDRIVGFSEWIETYDNGVKFLYLSMMQVDCDLRGKGVGGAMLADGERYAAGIGASCLRTTPEDERAIEFYHKYGFTKTDSTYSCVRSTVKREPVTQHGIEPIITLDDVNANEFIFGLCQSSGRHMYEVANHNPDNRFEMKMPRISNGFAQFRCRKGSKTAIVLFWNNSAATSETVSDILALGCELGFNEIVFYFKSKYVNLFADSAVTPESTEMERKL
jgi:GNAT superfamily N-acetyltransferase